MGMLDAIAASLGSAERETAAQSGSAMAARSGGRAARPVLQLNPLPVTLDPGEYRNAFSGRNPRGDYKALFAFRQLVDPAPAYSRNYAPSAGSTEQIYASLINGASVNGESDFAAGVLSEAKALFEAEKFANLDGTPGVWRPVYTAPEDWTTAGPERFQRIDIDLEAPTTKESAFATIRGGEELELRVGAGGTPETGKRSTGSRVRSIRIEYLLVGLRRPWLHPLVFETNDWFLSGQDAGFYSSGELAANDGVLPLIPTGLLLGRSVEISADWSTADASRLKSAKAAGQPVSLGPFLMSAPREMGSTLQVIGWTSELVPFSPKMTRKAAGSILVENMGGFVMRFSVEWNEGSAHRSQGSGIFPVLASREIAIPVNASKLSVKIEIMTFPAPFETWKTVAVIPFDKPVAKKYTVSGVTWNPVLKEG